MSKVVRFPSNTGYIPADSVGGNYVAYMEFWCTVLERDTCIFLCVQLQENNLVTSKLHFQPSEQRQLIRELIDWRIIYHWSTNAKILPVAFVYESRILKRSILEIRKDYRVWFWRGLLGQWYRCECFKEVATRFRFSERKTFQVVEASSNMVTSTTKVRYSLSIYAAEYTFGTERGRQVMWIPNLLHYCNQPLSWTTTNHTEQRWFLIWKEGWVFFKSPTLPYENNRIRISRY